MPKRFLDDGHKHSVAWEGPAQVHFGPGGVKFRQECACGWWRYRFVATRGNDTHGGWEPSRSHAAHAREANHTHRQRRAAATSRRSKVGARHIRVPGTDMSVEIHDPASNKTSLMWGGTLVTVTMGSGPDAEQVETTLLDLHRAAQAASGNPDDPYVKIAAVLPRPTGLALEKRAVTPTQDDAV